MWVPPSGWQEFLNAYRALTALQVSKSFAGAKAALVKSGAAYLYDANNSITVADDDLSEWLNQVQIFGQRVHNAGLQAQGSKGQQAPSGIAPDALRFYYGADAVSTPGTIPYYLAQGDYASAVGTAAGSVVSGVAGALTPDIWELAFIAALGVGALLLIPRMFEGHR